MANDKAVKSHIEALERAGYIIKKKRARTKTHTFIVDTELLESFKREVKARKFTMRAAIAEAMRLWLSK